MCSAPFQAVTCRRHKYPSVAADARIEQFRTYQAAKSNLQSEPGVARVLKVKEHRMRVGGIRVPAGLEVKRFAVPLIIVPRRFRRHGVTLQAETENRQTDEKYRDAGYALGRGGRVRLVEERPNPRP